MALSASVSLAQPAPKVPPRGIVQTIPALYWARLSAAISKRMPAFPKGLSAQVRLYLTPDGAVTQAVFLRHSGVDVFDRILERELAAFAVTADARLPVAKDPKMRAGAVEQGVTVVIRSRSKGKAASKGTQRINLPAGVAWPKTKNTLGVKGFKAVKPTRINTP